MKVGSQSINSLHIVLFKLNLLRSVRNSLLPSCSQFVLINFVTRLVIRKSGIFWYVKEIEHWIRSAGLLGLNLPDAIASEGDIRSTWAYPLVHEECLWRIHGLPTCNTDHELQYNKNNSRVKDDAMIQGKIRRKPLQWASHRPVPDRFEWTERPPWYSQYSSCKSFPSQLQSNNWLWVDVQFTHSNLSLCALVV